MRAPAIIIGVGGIGSDICARVEQMLPKDAPDRDYFRFVVMDTDVNTLRDIRRKGFGGTVIRLADNMTVNTCLAMLKKRKLADWYPENGIFANKAMTEGAGQYRAVSRLAFEYAVQEARLDELERLIRELNEISMDDSDQAVRFYIISSLAGGTGSGIALPVALYINHLYMEEKKEALFSCKGFFLMSSTLRQFGGKRLERESIDANAYAAVKELSAYMREADESRGRYKKPDVSYTGESNINAISGGKIYDYCYMFGMINKRGQGMHCFEDLKDLVANAVYMQACSPMHDRNSSLEDNTIKHLEQLARENQEQFLRRFGGIGCGELLYPYDKIKEYLAMCWAEEMIASHWQKYDQIYYASLREREEKRRQGKKVDAVDQGEEYILAVDNATDDFLAEEIVNECCPEGEEPIWKQYMKAMYDRIEADVDKEIERRVREEGSLINLCDSELAALGNDAGNANKQRIEARNNLCGLLRKLDSVVEGKSRKAAEAYTKSWFVYHDAEKEPEPHLVEYWMLNNGKFMHPNAVRYFLYQLKNAIAAELQTVDGSIEQTKEKREDINDFQEKKSWLFGKKKLNESYKSFSETYENIFHYAKHVIYRCVLQKCQEYVAGLCGEYERFYHFCDGMLDGFKRNCIEIGEVLDRQRGLSLSYVCADKECREQLFQQIKDSPYYSQAGRGLSAYIYQLLQNQKKGRGLQEYFYEQFRSYWIKNLEIEFDDIINMDVLEALIRQESFKSGRTMDAAGLKQYIQHVENVLIDPFLEYVGDCGHQQGISLCCYHEGLKEKSGIHREVVKWLEERRGVPDPYYCSQYQLMFYRSLVGLNASEITEYLHEHCDDPPLRKGKVFRAYENNIRDMVSGGDSRRDASLTPHVDKEWHSFLRMPDTNREYQQEMEIKTCVAFYYAWIIGKIKPGEKEGDGYKCYFGRKEEPVEEETLEDCLSYLYQYPGAAHRINLELLREVRKRESIDSYSFLDKMTKSPESIFQVLLRYYGEIELRGDSFVPTFVLLDAMVVLVGLFAKDMEEMRSTVGQFLSTECLTQMETQITERKTEPEYRKRRMKRIIDRTKNYLDDLDIVRIYGLCTRLFYTEKQMIRDMRIED